eukprot:GHVH01011608.1.p1 GENE.GHVH01011608.1~~GHVH01011608.1.p1  ORF type:complete len:1408 (+),score=221.66 GHVH01011608.1:38-4225(+)
MKSPKVKQAVIAGGKDEYKFLIARPGGLKRYDVWPFLFVIYPLMLWFSTWSGFWVAIFTDGAWDETIIDLVDVSSMIEIDSDVMEEDFEWATVCFVIWVLVLLSHLFTYLFIHWNVDWRMRLQFMNVPFTDGITGATHCYVIPSKKGENAAICDVKSITLQREHGVYVTKHSIEYNKQRMLWSNDKKGFVEVYCPVNLPLWKYINPSGLSSREIANAKALHGAVNNYDIELPTFMMLFKEHALAPFFVFQMVTMVLWMLDDMWQYSLFTMVTLVGMECQVVFRRQKEMAAMSDMQIPPRKLYCYRENKWTSVSSDDIIPGDIISLKGGEANSQIPADLLLLRGSCLTNEAILTGESVPQMKVDLECTVSFKSASAPSPGPELLEPLDIEGRDKASVLFAGTKLVQCQGTSSGDPDEFDRSLPGVFGQSTPDGGALCYVIRTAFATNQGQLVRTIFYSTVRVTADSQEAFCYLGILLIVALMAAGYVFWHEVDNAGRSKFRLVLNCILIITSVVPPEFPITMSMSVQMSLVQLLKLKIYCTEPFRVPFAGRLKFCAFDKTGTLTSDKLYLKGIVGIPGKRGKLVDELPEVEKTTLTTSKDVNNVTAQMAKKNKSILKHELCQSLPFMTAAVLGCCHSLLMITPDEEPIPAGNPKLGPQLKTHRDRPPVSPELVGDPMEIACFKSLRWKLMDKGHVESDGVVPDKFQIVRRFPFSSELQRMMVVVKLDASSPKSPVSRDAANDQVDVNCSSLAPPVHLKGKTTHMVLIKGSYEMIRILCKVPPSEEVDRVADAYMRKGLRVIGLAARFVDDSSHCNLITMDRSELERDFVFCGLACLDCPIKADTVECIDKLIKSCHKVSMITGDNPLTATQVAKDCQIIRTPDTPTFSLDSIDEEILTWKSQSDDSVHRDEMLSFHYSELRIQSKTKAFVVTGKKMAECFDGPSQRDEILEDMFTIIAQNTAVFARVSPGQKKALLLAMNRDGDHTLMCGDGTNDTGALKAAKVGISLISGGPETKEEKQKQLEQFSSDSDPSASVLRLSDGSCVTMQQLPPHLTKKWVQLKSQKMLSSWFKNAQLDEQIATQMKQLLAEIQSLKDSNPDALLKKTIAGNPKLNSANQEKAIESMQSKLDELAEEDLPALKLGDASIASPFAYKGSSIKCVPLIIQYGRASVVTVMMQYMIMALNALTTALMLSVLSLDGVKFSDRQHTVQALFLVVFNFQFSRPPPAETISPRKPIDSIFDKTFLCSWFGQSLVHLVCIASAWYLAFLYRDPDYDPDVDGDFKPNLLNTTMWLVMTIMHGTTFVANYPGSPFVASWGEISAMKNGLIFFFGGIFLLASEWATDLNEMIYLVALPNDTYKYILLAILTGDFVMAFGVARICNKWQEIRDIEERSSY